MTPLFSESHGFALVSGELEVLRVAGIRVHVGYKLQLMLLYDLDNYPISPHVYKENCNFWIRHMVAGGRREGLSQLNAKGELKSTFAQKVGV